MKIKMRNKLVLLAGVLLFSTISCGSKASDKNKAETKAEEQTTADNQSSEDKELKEGEPIYLDKQMFLDRVMNYEENPKEWVYKGEKPALVDFYADWCGPCKITSPILEELAEEYAGQIHIYKIDTDEQKELAAVFGVQSLPTFLYIPMEGDPRMSAGIARSPEETKQMFKDQIQEYLLSDL